MTAIIIETGVPDTSAAHIVRSPEATHSPHEMTVVWSTLVRHCEPGVQGHATAVWPADEMPLVWDSSGVGSWQIGAGVQCGVDGVRLTPHADIHDGHLDDAELTAAAVEVGSSAAAEQTRIVDRGPAPRRARRVARP